MVVAMTGTLSGCFRLYVYSTKYSQPDPYLVCSFVKSPHPEQHNMSADSVSVGGRKLEGQEQNSPQNECIGMSVTQSSSRCQATQFPLRVFHFNFVNNSVHVKIFHVAQIAERKMSIGNVFHLRFAELVCHESE